MSIILDDINPEEFVKNGEYLHSKYNDLIARYNNQYVAIKDQQVFRHAKTIEELEKLLQKENIERGTLLVEFIRDKRNFM